MNRQLTAKNDELARLALRQLDTITGGDSFCTLHFADLDNPLGPRVTLKHHGESQAALYFVRCPRETERMAAQQGYFSVSPQVLADHAQLLHEAALHVLPDPQFFRFTIRPDQKVGFLRRLLAMNVTARALFPGGDGLGKTAEELVRVTSLWRKATV